MNFNLHWMAWTRPTAVFFIGVFLMLTIMTIVSVKWPSAKTKGFLPITTTRGERLYIGLITSALIFVIWLGLTDATLWGAVITSLLWLFATMRWG